MTITQQLQKTADDVCEHICKYYDEVKKMEKTDKKKAYQLWNKMNEKQCDKCPLMRLV